MVATVPTVYGIETKDLMPMACPLGPPVATAPTVYGIETNTQHQLLVPIVLVATAPTVYGIETYHFASFANL